MRAEAARARVAAARAMVGTMVSEKGAVKAAVTVEAARAVVGTAVAE